jgi:hypothetical protein
MCADTTIHKEEEEYPSDGKLDYSLDEYALPFDLSTFLLMVSSTTTKITKTMKFLYHIYIGTSSQTN